MWFFTGIAIGSLMTFLAVSAMAAKAYERDQFALGIMKEALNKIWHDHQDTAPSRIAEKALVEAYEESFGVTLS